MEWPQVAGTAGTLPLMAFFIVAYTWTTVSDKLLDRRIRKMKEKGDA